MEEYEVVPASDVPEGQRVIAQIAGREIAILNIEGEYYAHTNWCPHQSGPVCEGTLSGTWVASSDQNDRSQISLSWERENEILNCPWHGWEFDVRTGECLSNQTKLASVSVAVKDGMLVVKF